LSVLLIVAVEKFAEFDANWFVEFPGVVSSVSPDSSS
jgi:hypothetical protein